MPGIEPGLHAPHARVLPVYYIPPSLPHHFGEASPLITLSLTHRKSGRRDSNPESPAPKAGMLAVTPRPVYAPAIQRGLRRGKPVFATLKSVVTDAGEMSHSSIAPTPFTIL